MSSVSSSWANLFWETTKAFETGGGKGPMNNDKRSEEAAKNMLKKTFETDTQCCEAKGLLEFTSRRTTSVSDATMHAGLSGRKTEA